MSSRNVFLTLAPCLLAGCGVLLPDLTVEPVVPRDLAPDTASAYVAIEANTRPGPRQGFAPAPGNHALFIKNTETGEEFKMSLQGGRMRPRHLLLLVSAVKVPPGTYAVSEWALGLKRVTIQNKALLRPFRVDGGAVVYLGKFSATTEVTQHGRYQDVFNTLTSIPISTPEAEANFFSYYPRFRNQVTVTCLTCEPL